MKGDWDALSGAAPDVVAIAGVEVRQRSRVVLRPRRRGGDVLDVVLAGRVAVVDGIEQDVDGTVQLAVVIADDPGRDLGEARVLGHRFFFGLDEVEPLDELDDRPPAAARVLVAGVGNVFLADDGFGPALAERLAARPLPEGVDVVDFGIRGLDLALALADYEVLVLLDAAPRGEAPGTISVIEPVLDEDHVAVEAHGMHPLAVLATARAMLGHVPRTLVVGCEPEVVMTGEEPEVAVGLSPAVASAVSAGVPVVEQLLQEITDQGRTT